jgi:hypothetical protein
MDIIIVLSQLASLVALVVALVMVRLHKPAELVSDTDRLEQIMNAIDEVSNPIVLDMLEIIVQQRRILCYVEHTERTTRLVKGCS